jgi:thioredoxin 1
MDSILMFKKENIAKLNRMAMFNRYSIVLALLLIITVFYACGSQPSDLASISLEKSLRNGKPTLAEFGWRECIPCKEMKPILEELAIEYKDRVNILIVEIPYHEDLADKYGIMVMPVQIFFDSSGQEVFRHAGFLPKEEIVDQLERMGIGS